MARRLSRKASQSQETSELETPSAITTMEHEER